MLCDVSCAEVIRGLALQEHLIIARIMIKVDSNRNEDYSERGKTSSANDRRDDDGADAKIRFLEILGTFALQVVLHRYPTITTNNSISR